MTVPVRSRHTVYNRDPETPTLERGFDRMGTAPNRELTLAPGPRPQIGSSDWRVTLKGTRTCSVEGCERPFYGRTWCRMHYARWQRNGDLIRRQGRPLSLPLAQRLANMTKVMPNGCIEWIGHRDKNGYGNISIDGKTKRAHRVSYEFAKGPIPSGLLLRHKCDNPPCVNPEHLEPGTNAENHWDRERRGRSYKGEGNPCAHLTNDQVRAIRIELAEGKTHLVLALKFGVGTSTISRIARGVGWKSVA